MNQSCRVCGEVAAGYHFGAFTCEGCKSFFGRTYNNRSSIGECKNANQCVINKKNRTSCKSCRLKKCFDVGMSKSGSRYGRRSNWFKIHCLLQDQSLMQQQHHHHHHHQHEQPQQPQEQQQPLRLHQPQQPSRLHQDNDDDHDHDHDQDQDQNHNHTQDQDLDLDLDQQPQDVQQLTQLQQLQQLQQQHQEQQQQQLQQLRQQDGADLHQHLNLSHNNHNNNHNNHHHHHLNHHHHHALNPFNQQHPLPISHHQNQNFPLQLTTGAGGAGDPFAARAASSHQLASQLMAMCLLLHQIEANKSINNHSA